MTDPGLTGRVAAAAVGNACLAVAKLAGAAWTGSAVLLAEAVHSTAATASQCCIVLAPKGRNGPHPGAADAAFRSFVIAGLVYSLASGVAITQGVGRLGGQNTLADPLLADPLLADPLLADPLLAHAILAVSALFQLGALWAIAGGLGGTPTARPLGRDSGPLRRPQDMAPFAILLETVVALAGLAIALAAIAATQLGWRQADALGSIAIGLVLGVLAAIMAIRTRAVLAAQTVAATEDPARPADAEFRTPGIPVPPAVPNEPAVAPAARGSGEAARRNHPPAKPGKAKGRRHR